MEEKETAQQQLARFNALKNRCANARACTYGNAIYVDCRQIPNEKLSLEFIEKNCLLGCENANYCEEFKSIEQAELDQRKMQLDLDQERLDEERLQLKLDKEKLRQERDALEREKLGLDDFDEDDPDDAFDAKYDLNDMEQDELEQLYCKHLCNESTKKQAYQFEYMANNYTLLHKLNSLTAFAKMHNPLVARSFKLYNVNQFKTILQEAQGLL